MVILNKEQNDPFAVTVSRIYPFDMCYCSIDISIVFHMKYLES